MNNIPPLHPQNAIPNQSKLVISPEHDQPIGTWTEEQIKHSVNENVMLTWAPNKAR
jgi:hypothetical protein